MFIVLCHSGSGSTQRKYLILQFIHQHFIRFKVNRHRYQPFWSGYNHFTDLFEYRILLMHPPYTSWLSASLIFFDPFLQWNARIIYSQGWIATKFLSTNHNSTNAFTHFSTSRYQLRIKQGLQYSMPNARRALPHTGNTNATIPEHSKVSYPLSSV